MKEKFMYFLMLFASCTTSRGMVGTYYNEGLNYKKNLKLNKDGSFLVNIETFDSKASCHGKWELLSKDTILLKCDTESFPATITNRYISEREQKVIVVRNDKIRYQKTILTRLPRS